MNQGRVWYKYSWIDSRLAYDTTKFGGISNFKVDASLIWVPDITLYNRYVQLLKSTRRRKKISCTVKSILFPSIRHDSHRPSQAWKVRGEYPNAIVYPNGKILLIPDTHLEAVCHEADLRYMVTLRLQVMPFLSMRSTPGTFGANKTAP